ncbi:amidohydrolase 2 [Coniophora puteana RWD-64-598 SS2]|uniref:Amidohydrolase 2 n=1 Tax=Coniophora puteana (strain RWD-64-598) TaxID=741705 RepID=A0A5M3MSW6_CONPW|nr:amidohydrolase 2 [Coniophora puteana RWD-64-598 SS2]EIW82137.1 amidohydrolase 2 [Coniophora puteana RWD-64-598 SS2]
MDSSVVGSSSISSENLVHPLSRHKVDVHHHIFLNTESKLANNIKAGWRTPEENLPWSPEISLAAMDALGIQFAFMSPPPLSPPKPSIENREQMRAFNDYAAHLSQTYPGRFGVFAGLPSLDDLDGALAEIEYALGDLKADGIALVSSYGEGGTAKYIGHNAYDAVWAELDRRCAIVFLHGAQTPSSTPFPHPLLGLPVVEVPNETFKAAAHLVVTGKKRRYPNIKIVLSHLGGSLPLLAARVAALSPHMGCELNHQDIIDDFKSFYYETALSAHEVNLAAMEKFVPLDHILFGSDFPAVSVDMVQWYTHNLEEYFRDDPAKLHHVARGNALELFPRLAFVLEESDTPYSP